MPKLINDPQSVRHGWPGQVEPSVHNPWLQAKAREFHSHCRAIISRAKESRGAGFTWALGYCQAGLELHTASGIRSQILYILANLTGWRGPEARATKQKLKDLHAELSGEGSFTSFGEGSF